jgi:hypothetical protein
LGVATVVGVSIQTVAQKQIKNSKVLHIYNFFSIYNYTFLFIPDFYLFTAG